MESRYNRDIGMNGAVPEFGSPEYNAYRDERLDRVIRDFWSMSVERQRKMYVDPDTGYQWMLD